MAKILLSADPHWGHNNIIRYCDRPFESKLEHDEALITNWNSVVNKEDMVYLLGDCGFGSPEWLMNKVFGRLKGKIGLILGNHDKRAIKPPLCNRFEFIKDVHLLRTKLNGKDIRVWMSHYAHLSWPFSNHGSFHAFGHSHSKLKGVGRSLDVGVDCWNYFPITLETFINAVEEKYLLEQAQKMKDEDLSNL